MADDLAEGSIYNQIKAIEGWALTAYQESLKKVPNVDEILENLRKINLQARKLEWRGKGLDSLPKGRLAEDVKKKITQLRAAVVTLRDIKKDKELSNSSKRTIRILTAVAAEAIKLVEGLARIPFEQFDTNPILLEDFLRGEENFAHLTQEMRRTLWNNSPARGKLRLRNLDLSKADLKGFNFSGMNITNCKFVEANISATDFSECIINSPQNDDGYQVNNPHFKGVSVGTNFHKCSLVNVSLSGVFSKADFSSARFRNVMLSEAEFIECNFQNAWLLELRSSYSVPIFTKSDLRGAIVDLIKFPIKPFAVKRPVHLGLSGANVNQTRFLITKSHYPLSYDLLEAKNGNNAKIEMK